MKFSPKIRCICKCGLENQGLQDWTAHWKYGIKRPQVKPFGNYPKLRAIYLFLFTRISISFK